MDNIGKKEGNLIICPPPPPLSLMCHRAVFDGLVDDYGLYKLDTSGDCYIVAAGIIQFDEDGMPCW